MRTTINVNDDLLSRAKLHAMRTDRTLTAVIEDALRVAMDGSHHAGDTEAGDDLPVDGSGGPLPGIDLDDTSALLDLHRAVQEHERSRQSRSRCLSRCAGH
jgi:hypothetical protein